MPRRPIVALVMLGALLACKKGPPQRTTQPAPAPQPPPEAGPAPAPKPTTITVGGLELGRHACVVQDSSGPYNRVCVLTKNADGSVALSSTGGYTTGGRLTAKLTGGPEVYDLTGNQSGYGCYASVKGRLEATTLADGSEWFSAKLLGCSGGKLMIRRPTTGQSAQSPARSPAPQRCAPDGVITCNCSDGRGGAGECRNGKWLGCKCG